MAPCEMVAAVCFVAIRLPDKASIYTDAKRHQETGARARSSLADWCCRYLSINIAPDRNVLTNTGGRRWDELAGLVSQSSRPSESGAKSTNGS